jgi:hypothetical protein
MKSKPSKPNLALKAERDASRERLKSLIQSVAATLEISIAELKTLIRIEFDENYIPFRKMDDIAFSLSTELNVNLWYNKMKDEPLFKGGVSPTAHFRYQYLSLDGISFSEALTLDDQSLHQYSSSLHSRALGHLKNSNSLFEESNKKNELFQEDEGDKLYKKSRVAFNQYLYYGDLGRALSDETMRRIKTRNKL